MKRTSTKQKIILIIFGLFLTVVLLEVGLRIGGFVLLSLQEYRNRISIKQKGTYRIMCLGGSTTAGGGRYSYPRQLEEVLNQRDLGIKFSVINKGRIGTNTAAILLRLQHNLNEYTPDMVITMMGINDGDSSIPYEDVRPKKTTLFFKSFRTYKVARLLWLHIVNKARGIGIYKTEETRKDVTIRANDLTQPSNFKDQEKIHKKAIELNPKNNQAYFHLADFYWQELKYDKAEEMYKKAIELNPKNAEPHVHLARIYREQGYDDKAEEMFKKAIELSPKNDWTYIRFARLHRKQGCDDKAEEMYKKAIELNPKNAKPHFDLAEIYKQQRHYDKAEEMFKKAIELSPKNDWTHIRFARLHIHRKQKNYDKAEAMYKKAIELNPKNNQAYCLLAYLYWQREKYDKAEEMYKKAIELNPKNDRVCGKIAGFYRKQKNYDKAEAMYKKAIELNPESNWWHIDLGLLYKKQGYYGKAENMFKKAIELNSKNDKAYGGLAICYKEWGMYKLAEEYFRKANRLRSETYNPMTHHNYQRLKKIAAQREIRLVCVQYPMRNIKPLKKMLKPHEDIIFVDNEGVFKKALEQADYDEYFKDYFGGDFGYCTAKGNRLLAENIANVILKECFNNIDN